MENPYITQFPDLMSGKKIIIKNETEKFTVKVPLLYE